MKNGRIDAISDFTPRGLGQLKTWLEPWFIGGAPLPPGMRDAMLERLSTLETRLAELEQQREGA